jgi:hypothetical protein
MTTSVAVVAHPERLTSALLLRDQVQADHVSVDHFGRGEQWNHQEALEALARQPDQADWLVLLEDDAIPCSGFRAQLDRALEHAPAGIVSLYLGTGRWAGTAPSQHEPVVRGLVEDADRDGAQWITTGALWHAVGVAIPREHAVSLLQHLRGSTRPTDEAITDWCRQRRVAVHYTHPSLVDPRDERRLVHAREQHVPRRAWRFEEAGRT